MNDLGGLFLLLVLVAGAVMAHVTAKPRRQRAHEDSILAAADEIRSQRAAQWEHHARS